MTSLTLLLLCVAPSSDAAAPSTDFAVNLRLASATTHAPLSSNWAMSYYQAPRLIGAPAPVDEPTTSPPIQQVSEFTPIGPDPFPDGAVDLMWRDWSMKDMSLEWGLATIGPGVLAPQSGAVSGRPGGGAPGGGGGSQQPTPTFIFIPPTIQNPTPITPPPPNAQAVPEAGAMFLWIVLVGAMILGANHWNKPPAVVASPCPA
jgi:hypothetical protein